MEQLYINILLQASILMPSSNMILNGMSNMTMAFHIAMKYILTGQVIILQDPRTKSMLGISVDSTILFLNSLLLKLSIKEQTIPKCLKYFLKKINSLTPSESFSTTTPSPEQPSNM